VTRLYRLFIVFSIFTIQYVIGGSHYTSLNNQQLYSLIEYALLIDTVGTDIFILNQPYNSDQISHLVSRNKKHAIFNSIYDYSKIENSNNINVRVKPQVIMFSSNQDRSIYNSIELDGVISISDASFVNEIELGNSFKLDSTFHGDKSEWLMGYFSSSYGIFKTKSLQIFSGRISRNFGALNDYGLILSNNPFAFDHFGFSAYNKKIQYSFYATRLNDVSGEDIQGVIIPIDSISNSKRFWAIQRLDYKINQKLQMAFTEATIYGGPDQQFVAAYLNPTHLFYAAQRNQRVQLNSFWQINAFYKPITGVGIYIDLFADDLIVNNETGVDDRAVHPDRLGLMIKGSYANENNTLQSLRYVRIWNETYTSYRTFENYTYFKKGMGYPYNSFEGLKYSVSKFSLLPLFIEGEVEVWRQGARDLIAPFHDELNNFPVGPTASGLTLAISVSYMLKSSLNLKFDYNQKILPKIWNSDTAYDEEYWIQLSAQYYLKKAI
jgi:hypothetical protein